MRQTNIKYPVIVLFGPPGCGKGTQANLICEELNLVNLSIGSSVREFVKDNDSTDSPEQARAVKIKSNLQSGELLDFEDVKYIVEADILSCIENFQNILIEGLPRTHEQAIWLSDFFAKNQVESLFFHFIIDENTVLERLNHRYYVPGSESPYASYEEALKHCKTGETPIRRKDDMNQDIIRHRYEIQYNSCKEQILETMNKSSLVEVIDIDACPAPSTIFKDVMENIFKQAQQFSTH